MKHSYRYLTLFLFLLIAASAHAAAGSILAVRSEGPGRMLKVSSQSYQAQLRSQTESGGLESLSYRGFTILLNPVSNGSYELQVSRIVAYGTHRVSSVFSSIYRSSIEYGYGFDSNRNQIVQHHFLFPPNSLTGWANPGDFAAMTKFDWGAAYPIRNCSQSTPIHSLEESGREYLEASCIPNRDTALAFGKEFVDYMLGNRGL